MQRDETVEQFSDQCRVMPSVHERLTTKWSSEFQIFSDSFDNCSGLSWLLRTTAHSFLCLGIQPIVGLVAVVSAPIMCFDSSNELDPNADPYSYFQTSQQRYGTCQLNLLQPKAWYFCCQLVRYKVDKFPHFLHFFSSCAHIHFTHLNF